MRILDGLELRGYITERQAKQVRALRQSWKVFPKLAIIQTIDDDVIDTYVRMKKAYGEDILVEVNIYKIDQADLMSQIQTLNNDASVHGIITQLPLADPTQTDVAVNAVAAEKDVDGLGDDATLTPATAMAIDWLLAGYNIDFVGKEIAIVGNGRLVGAPLAKLWKSAGYNVNVYDKHTVDLPGEVLKADIIVTATGVPSLIKANMVKNKAVIVDAGTAAEHGKIVGDVAEEVRDLDDVTITPLKGGVGPLTVAALFDNVIRAATAVAEKKGQQDL
ncbi:bifunctional methylenetetrahydrofolate dehydrogenase/methenyltetrahydrofolate cyclohydrolase FolD [soil metagenome]